VTLVKHLTRVWLAVVLLTVSGCEAVPLPSVHEPVVDLPPAYTDHGVTITVDGLWKNDYGQVLGISGTAKNVGAVDLLTCMVHLDIVDGGGVKVSDAVASTQGLARGQTWRFQATLMSPFSVSFKAVRPGQVMVFAQRR
jgi:hypothetical protein